MSNPVFTRKKEARSFGSAPEFTPADAMTYDDVIMKTMFCMALLLAAGVVGWAFPGLALIGTGVAFVLALFAIFKKKVSPPLILAYSAFEGLALGGLSAMYEAQYEGIVIQAVLGTVSVFAATLAVFKFGNVRATPKMMRILLVAMLGYVLYSVVNLAMVITGAIDTPFGISSMMIPGTSIPVGVVVGLLVVVLAAFNLIADFTVIESDVHRGAPASEAWRNAFGLMLTIVWLYVELLRLLAILRGK